MTVWVNTIVYNEENFIWFAVMSVVDYVDKVLIYDTGSTDKTVEIIKELIKVKGEKIEFKEVGPVDPDQFTIMRQRMLENSKCDWILILDGDEVWWKDSIKKLIKEIEINKKTEGIVVPMIVPVGDIYHLQGNDAGRYEILGKKGHFSLRVISTKIPSLHVDLPYGKEGYFDGNNIPVQQRENITFLDAPYFHTTHLRRSSSKRKTDKFKYEIGRRVPQNFRFPEVFYYACPSFVQSPFKKITSVDLIKASLMTPLRKIKRRFKVK